MKKAVVIALSLLLLSVCGCSAADKPTVTEPPPRTEPFGDRVNLTITKYLLKPDMTREEVLAVTEEEWAVVAEERRYESLKTDPEDLYILSAVMQESQKAELIDECWGWLCDLYADMNSQRHYGIIKGASFQRAENGTIWGALVWSDGAPKGDNPWGLMTPSGDASIRSAKECFNALYGMSRNFQFGYYDVNTGTYLEHTGGNYTDFGTSLPIDESIPEVPSVMMVGTGTRALTEKEESLQAELNKLVGCDFLPYAAALVPFRPTEKSKVTAVFVYTDDALDEMISEDTSAMTAAIRKAVSDFNGTDSKAAVNYVTRVSRFSGVTWDFVPYEK